jgi:hypothetical protein
MFFDKILSYFQKDQNKDQNKELANNKRVVTKYNYLINDPTTPGLKDDIVLPITGLKYSVRDFKLNPVTSNEKRAVACYVTLGNQINYIQKISLNLIKKWAGPSILNVVPLAGNDLNAYYDRSSLKFFYFRTPKKVVCTSDSADIVSHELGHALLDAIRPDFWDVSALEIWAFHEAFGDITAMVSIMQYDKLLNQILIDTSNDISKSNKMSRLAEEMGISIYNFYDGKNLGYMSNALRDCCSQKFKYINPSTLPTDGLENELIAESHSFGKVFVAAWYEIFLRIYRLELNGNAPLQALKKARDAAYSILVLAIPNSARTVKYYSSIAKSMVDLSKNRYPNYQTIVNDVFVEWGILSNSVKMLSSTKWSDVVYNLNKKDRVVKTYKGTTVCLFDKKTIKLPGVSAMSLSQNLMGVDIEIPSDSYYEFDKNGNLIDEILPNNDEILESAVFCAPMIQKSLGKEWSIKDNKLVRKYIS